MVYKQKIVPHDRFLEKNTRPEKQEPDLKNLLYNAYRSDPQEMKALAHYRCSCLTNY